MSGIHLHPYDIIDEGMDAILNRIDRMKQTDLLFIEVNTIFERNPYPTGILPHNPKHNFVQGTGTLHAKLNLPDLPLCQRVDDSILQGNDPLSLIQHHVQHQNSRYKIVPWLNILNGDFIGAVTENQVIDYKGNPVENWLCPNGPDVVNFWSKTLNALQEQYGFNIFLIDRIRYPDWAGKTVSPRGLLTCFCSHCQKKMIENGIQIEKIKSKLQEISSLMLETNFERVVDIFLQDPLLHQWVIFRQRSVSQMIDEIKNQLNSGVTLWLDLWPPAYSWILGQNYSALTKHTTALKHFPYHKLGGGADVQGLINYFAQDEQTQERGFKAFMRLFSLNYDLTYKAFKQQGFPIVFVKEQNELVRTLSKEGMFIFSGIQMWNLSVNELIEAIKASKQSPCDDQLYYCYGWADEALFDAVGMSNEMSLS